MITIRAWHGTLPPSLSKEIDAFATPVQPGYEWTFQGTIAEFSEKWRRKFLAIPQTTDPKEEWPCDWFIGVTQFGNFNAR